MWETPYSLSTFSGHRIRIAIVSNENRNSVSNEKYKNFIVKFLSFWQYFKIDISVAFTLSSIVRSFIATIQSRVAKIFFIEKPELH